MYDKAYGQQAASTQMPGMGTASLSPVEQSVSQSLQAAEGFLDDAGRVAAMLREKLFGEAEAESANAPCSQAIDATARRVSQSSACLVGSLRTLLERL